MRENPYIVYRRERNTECKRDWREKVYGSNERAAKYRTTNVGPNTSVPYVEVICHNT